VTTRAVLGATLVAAAGLVLGAPGAGGAQPGPTLRVGLVLEPGVTAFEESAVTGLRRAVRELGVQGRVLTPSPREGYRPSFVSLAREQYDLVLGLGPLQARGLAAAARMFPHTRFAIFDVRQEWFENTPHNVWAIRFAEQEAGYLAGYLSGLLEKTTPGRDVVSSVGGVKFPPVDRYIAGFQAGARAADPGIRTLNAYSGNFIDASKCSAVAEHQIANGSHVVFNVAGACGVGALRAAARRGVWGIGVDLDQSALAAHVLTSALKRLDVAVFETVRTAMRGGFKAGGTTVLGLREGGVALAGIDPSVPRRLVARLAGVKAEIVAGKIRIPTTVR
jgi:basic membrane protein A